MEKDTEEYEDNLPNMKRNHDGITQKAEEMRFTTEARGLLVTFSQVFISSTIKQVLNKFK